MADYNVSSPLKLDDIFRAEVALRRARAELDQRVEERTAELAASNAALRAEIAERQRGEAALQESEERLDLIEFLKKLL